MKTVPLNKEVALKARPAWVEVGADTYQVSFAVHSNLWGIGMAVVKRHDGEPWANAIEDVAKALEAQGVYLAGSPRAKRRRPKMLLVVDMNDVKRFGFEVVEV